MIPEDGLNQKYHWGMEISIVPKELGARKGEEREAAKLCACARACACEREAEPWGFT